jgi:signal transduction histidine kinase
MINGDEQLMKVLLTNLMDNACKYSDNNSVKITLSSIHNKNISIEFLNTGRGIEAEEMDKIFQPFYRGKATAKISGFGVGLSLALKITLLHNGTLTVASIPGIETRFTLIIPITV